MGTCLLPSIASAQGIPEPSLIFYGTIRNAADNNYLMTRGLLNFSLLKTQNNRSIRLNTVAGNYGGFSYVLEIPAEQLVSGPVSSNVLELTAGVAQFVWTNVTFELNGAVVPVSFTSPSQSAFAASARDRGRITRMDLSIFMPCEDIDGNGLCDWWEILYFGAPSGCGDTSFDCDGDGLTNGQEYRLGSDPTDPDSGPLFLSWNPVTSAGGQFSGIQLGWRTFEGGATYGIYRSTNVLSLLATNIHATSVLIASNILATPPRNTFTDTNVSLNGTFFYRLRLE